MNGQTILMVAFTLLMALTAVGQGKPYKLTDETTYFPFELYKRRNPEGMIEIDSTLLRFHSQCLAMFNEPRLFNATSAIAIYRFTWIRSFHPAMVITLVPTQERASLEIKYGNKERLDNSHYDLSQLSDADRERYQQYRMEKTDSASIADLFQKGIYKRDPVKFTYSSRNKKISNKDCEAFNKLLFDKGFWTYPSMETVNGADGAEWILEGLSPEKGYHMIYRWSPDKDRDYDYRKMCEYLITLTGIVEKRDIY